MNTKTHIIQAEQVAGIEDSCYEHAQVKLVANAVTSKTESLASLATSSKQTLTKFLEISSKGRLDHSASEFHSFD